MIDKMTISRELYEEVGQQIDNDLSFSEERWKYFSRLSTDPYCGNKEECRIQSDRYFEYCLILRKLSKMYRDLNKDNPQG